MLSVLLLSLLFLPVQANLSSLSKPNKYSKMIKIQYSKDKIFDKADLASAILWNSPPALALHPKHSELEIMNIDNKCLKILLQSQTQNSQNKILAKNFSKILNHNYSPSTQNTIPDLLVLNYRQYKQIFTEHYERNPNLLQEVENAKNNLDKLVGQDVLHLVDEIWKS